MIVICRLRAVLALSLALSAVALNTRAASGETSQPTQSSAIAEIIQKAMKNEHLRAVIVKVTQGDKVIISQAFGESMTGVPATTAMHLREKVLDPMSLKNTTASQTTEIPSPVLHAFDSERRTALKIPANIPFYEESSFWNSQWGTPIGANQTTNIDDMATTAVKVGTGALLLKSSYEAMTGPHLLGFGKKQDNCAPS